MAHLEIPVERLHEGPLVLEVDVRPEALDLTDEEFTFKGRVTGEILFRLIGQDVMGSGKLHAQAEARCVRCLAPAQVDLDVAVEEVWLHERPDEPIDQEFDAEAPLTRTFIGDLIELDEPFRELIMAELPDHPLCAETCRGLCPGCGSNLNEEPCQCQHEHQAEEDAPAQPEWKKTLKKLRLE